MRESEYKQKRRKKLETDNIPIIINYLSITQRKENKTEA
jgi:hypothetical protein